MASFMKKGGDAQKMHHKAEKDAEARKKAAENKAYRFWVPQEDEAQITFLDGELDAEGVLSAPTFWEHNLKLAGKWGNTFACTQLEEECPICESGDNAYLITLFTIIDHRSYTDKQNKKHQHNKRLFACKRETFKRLQKIAAKRGGLAGITFDVSRGGDKSASVGDTFDFVEKRTLPEIAKAYGLKGDDVAPFDYEAVVPYFTASELIEQGLGSADSAAASNSHKPKGKTKTSSDDDDGDGGIGAGDGAQLDKGYEDEV